MTEPERGFRILKPGRPGLYAHVGDTLIDLTHPLGLHNVKPYDCRLIRAMLDHALSELDRVEATDAQR